MEKDNPEVEIAPTLAEEQPKEEKKTIKINWKIVAIVVAAAVVLVLAYFLKGLVVAATVNGSPISRFAVIEKLEKSSGKVLLDSLITKKLIAAEAKAKNITVSQEEIDEQIKKIEEQIKTQGGTLEEALKMQGMERKDLEEQIVIQKQVEKMVADKIAVSDEEVTKYIADYKIEIAKDDEAATREQVKQEISNMKLNQEAEAMISRLKAEAKIKYFVEY